MFKDKVLLITGGTGSFGNAVLNRFLETDIKEIRIFSRDEKKQDDMRKKYNNSKLKFYIGDVRDYSSILSAARGVDFIYHAAALKQVPSCEFHPLEAVKTNVLGTENVLEAAIANQVKRIVCLSTDKAVYPINAMGISKAMMEKVMVAKSRNVNSDKTVICGTRYGNVMASRGSVIPLFVDLIKAGKALTITDPNMTRFMMTLEDAVDLVLYAFEHGNNGDIFVQKAPAATIETLAIALKELLNVEQHPVNVIGTRHGEKLYEALLSREEMIAAIDMGDYYRVPPDLRDLNYGKYVEQGDSRISAVEDYNSHNTQRLDVEGMKTLLLKLPFIRALRAADLETGLQDADFVYHLAGINRPKNVDEFAEGNSNLTQQIVDYLLAKHKSIPIMISSSIQAELVNAYGQSKAAAEKHIERYAAESGAAYFIYRYPNVFGKWCKPNYNSFVATFCHNIANNIDITINDSFAPVNLVYIDDVCSDAIKLLSGKVESGYKTVKPVYSTTVGEVAELLYRFKESRSTLVTEAVGTGFIRALYSTWLSYLPADMFAYSVPSYGDARGVFCEMLKTPSAGQFSFFTAHPGITRGGHYHHTKNEKFLVIRGQACFRFEHVITGERYEMNVSSDEFKIVETVPGWTHDVTNIGADELIVMLWANEIFSRDEPDTIARPL